MLLFREINYLVLVIMPVNADHLRQRINEALEAKSELKRLTSKSFAKLDLNEKYAIRYHIIVLAEALGSICVHIATEDFAREPRSFSECFSIMEEKHICECAKDLIALMRLRNLLTHRYWTIDDAQVYDSIKNDFKEVDRFLRRVEEKYGISI